MDEEKGKTPYLDALKKYMEEGITPFDVPGHHMGNVESALKDLIGKKAFQADVNAPIGLDNLANPKGVLKESMDLMAAACNADHAFFLINGTSSGIIAMIMAACKPNDKIIVPRNVHKSITNAMILSGAHPIYIAPRIDMQLEIAHQPSLEDYKRAILKFPSAKAILVINPTYFGSIIDLKELTIFAHAHNCVVLVDEAHGAHYYFNDKAPYSAMECGCDMASVSFHKTGGSLTQSSVLLLKSDSITPNDVQKALNILNTTSPSTLLLASIDAARAYMEVYGEEAMDRTYELADYAYQQIKDIPGFIPRGRKHFVSKGCFEKDITKLVIEIDRIPLTGSEIYQMLKRDHHIQMELSETYVILGIIAIGTTKKHIDNLVKALKAISKKYYNPKLKYVTHDFDMSFPYMLIRPRTAYYAPSKNLPLEECEYAISKESIMIYPPGIPIVVPGEVITSDIIKRIQKYQNSKDITILGLNNDGTACVVDTDQWKRFEVYRPRIERYINKRITNPRNDGFYLYNRNVSGYTLLVNYVSSISRNRRINNAFHRELDLIIETLSEHTDIQIIAKTKDIKEHPNSVENVSVLNYNLPATGISSIPFFVQNETNKVRLVSYHPNYTIGVNDAKADYRIFKALYKLLKNEVYFTESYLPEQRSFTLDGVSNCIVLDEPLTLEDSVIKLSRREIEENIKVYFNVENVTWIPKIPDELREKGYHLSDILCFIKEGVVAVSYPKDKGVLLTYAEKLISLLKKENYEVVRFPIVFTAYPNKMECNAFDLDINEPLIGSFTPFIIVNNHAFIPNNYDEKAKRDVIRKLMKYHQDITFHVIDTYYLNLIKSNLKEFFVRIPLLKSL